MYTKSQPLGRLGSVRDIADATVYLLSNTGSYVNGQLLVGMFSVNHIVYAPCLCSLQLTED